MSSPLILSLVSVSCWLLLCVESSSELPPANPMVPQSILCIAAMYYAPGRTTLIGASIPKGKGVPSYSVLDNFVPCQEGEGTLKRNYKCSESSRNGGTLKVGGVGVVILGMVVVVVVPGILF